MANDTIPDTFYNINSGDIQQIKFGPIKAQEFIQEMNDKFDWNEFDSYNNKYYEYFEFFFQSIFTEINEKKIFSSMEELYENLTKQQKSFYSLFVLQGQVSNGGLSQFFYNREQYIYSCLQALNEIGFSNLHKLYKTTLVQYLKNEDDLDLKRMLANIENDEKSKWGLFKSFTNRIRDTSKDFDNEFFEKEKYFMKTMVEYIELNLTKFAKPQLQMDPADNKL